LNHYTWTYAAGEGRNYNVGLFHSNKTGHLLIYIGSKIVTIDFNVLESKTYSFFIEDELCRIVLERKGDVMFYAFEIDKKANTPRNQARNALERKFNRQLLLSLGIFAAVIAIFVIWNPFGRSKLTRAEDLLLKEGRETTGTIMLRKDPLKPGVMYQFIANNRGYTVPANLSSSLSENGMPLEEGDEFVVLYVASEPSINHINFNQPTERQIGTYQKRAVERHLQLHPEEAPFIAACMVNVAYQVAGIAGIADFYFQDVQPGMNPDHNQFTYLRLVRDLPFQKKVDKECWQK
jgi:hypothetical protein